MYRSPSRFCGSTDFLARQLTGHRGSSVPSTHVLGEPTLHGCTTICPVMRRATCTSRANLYVHAGSATSETRQSALGVDRSAPLSVGVVGLLAEEPGEA